MSMRGEVNNTLTQQVNVNLNSDKVKPVSLEVSANEPTDVMRSGNLVGSVASHGDDVTRLLDDKIRDIERKIIEGKLVFVDDDGVPLPRKDGFPDIGIDANIEVYANDTVN